MRSNFTILLVLTLLCQINPVLAQNDTLLLSNYDVIVGEVKGMNRGVLTVETNYSDADFKIEWDGIRKLNIFNYANKRCRPL